MFKFGPQNVPHFGLDSCFDMRTVDICQNFILIMLPVADPGFSPGGAPTPKLGLFCKFFAENCMKMKEFGPRGEARPAPLRSANGYSRDHGKLA